MTIHDSITVERILQAVEEDSNLGFCAACGADAYGVEPDARKYKCNCCGAEQVYGAEEMLVTMVS